MQHLANHYYAISYPDHVQSPLYNITSKTILPYSALLQDEILWECPSSGGDPSGYPGRTFSTSGPLSGYDLCI